MDLNCPSSSTSCFQDVQSIRSDFISVPSLPSLRPEFRTASFTQAEHERTQSVMNCLIKCLPAARLLEQHENELLETGVIGDQRTFLPSLEKHLRDFARSGVYQGIFYATLYHHQGRCQPFTLARIIEYGCMQGVSFKEEVREVFIGRLQATEKLFTYNVFSEKDLSEGNRKRKRTDSRDRSAEIFKNNVHMVENHLASLQASSRSITCLKGGAILLLKKKSERSKQKDRFFFCFGLDGNAASFDWQQLEKILNDYRTTGLERPRMHLHDLGSDPDVQQQLEAIGSISHDTDNISRYNGDGVLSKPTQSFFPCIFIICWKMKQGRHTPYMLRIRLLRYLLDKNMKQIHALLQVPDAVVAGSEETSMLQVSFQAAERRVAEMRTDMCTRRTKRRVTAEDVQQEFGLKMPPVINMASELTDYSSFKISFLEQGHLYWVRHKENTDVFVMNDYSTATYKFLVKDFIQVHVSEGTVTSCTCGTQKTFLRTNENSVCIHWRFLEEEILGLMERVQQADFVPKSSIGRKLLQAWQGCNTGCVTVGPASGKTCKFCVIGRDDTVAFVHLSLSNSFVCCKSGECRRRMGSKKKLQDLNSAADLCPHLDIFKASLLQVSFQAAEKRVAEMRTDVCTRWRVTAEDVQQEFGLEMPPVINMASELTDYSSFKISLLEQGHLYWVRHKENTDVFVMNDYSTAKSKFLVKDFIQVHVSEGTVTSCTCGTQKTFLRTNENSVCIHWRFLEEEILGLMERVQQADFVPEYTIGRKLLQAWHGCNTGCVAVGPASGKTRKFCVIGRDDTVAFVHLSLDNSFVCCKSGECRRRMGSKKKLQDLNSAANLCPHLDIFKASDELWEPFRDDGAAKEKDDAEYYPVVDENIDDQYQIECSPLLTDTSFPPHSVTAWEHHSTMSCPEPYQCRQDDPCFLNKNHLDELLKINCQLTHLVHKAQCCSTRLKGSISTPCEQEGEITADQMKGVMESIEKNIRKLGKTLDNHSLLHETLRTRKGRGGVARDSGFCSMTIAVQETENSRKPTEDEAGVDTRM